jgi:hypothetical protein
MKRPTKWSKAWWIPELTDLRKEYSRAVRRSRKTQMEVAKEEPKETKRI